MDSYIYIITALLPLVAVMVILQVNPYHALAIRGMLGAVATLVYAVLGAADVALTEALVGTLLAITLYAVAVRASMVLRLGVLEDDAIAAADDPDDPQTSHFKQMVDDLRTLFAKRHLRVELISYLNPEDLHRALLDKEVHATCARAQPKERDSTARGDPPPPYHMTTRLPRLYEILQTEFGSPITYSIYINVSPSKEEHP
jgi:putative multicomponent Na+:H+ antiporter subunit B